jgi:VWFA-related protein
MSRTLACRIALIIALTSVTVLLPAQTAAPDANTPETATQNTPVIPLQSTPVSTLRINSRSVLVDVVVTDKSGKPVTGLKQDAFTVTEQGKPQEIGFFEEHAGMPAAAAPVEMPKYPPDVFSNFSPFPQPAAVNVLLLDSLNTRMEDQAVVHQQALKFLKSAKAGTRMAIFTMGLGLHFIQGFNDDPAVLAAALNNKKNNEVQSSEMLKGQEESNAQANLAGMMSTTVGGTTVAPQAMVEALQNFINENDTSQSIDEGFITLANVQRLATFLEGFPGRKNIIWFAEKMPSVFITGTNGTNNPALGDEISKTLAMLASARAAIYPVYARGIPVNSLYTAENNLSKAITQPSQLIGPNGAIVGSLNSDDAQRNSEISSAQILAEQSGGRAFATNGMADVMKKVTSDSSYFYTLSYSPTNAKMDGSFRTVEVKIPGEKYKLSYRQGYFAMDAALPGSAMNIRNHAIAKLAAQNPGAVDPLLPFMDLAMPQSQQILYKVRIVPGAAGENEAAEKKGESHYKVDFAVDLKDLYLKDERNGQHKGALNVSLIVYDRYGKIVTRDDHIAQLNIKPDVYAIFEQTGVQMHAELSVPKGQYWLRTGVYDQGSHKLGTMEVALSSVVPLEEVAPLEASIQLQGSVSTQGSSLRTSMKAPATTAPRIAEKVTVEQLEHTLDAAHKKRDQDLAKLLGDMELSERLDSKKLANIQAELPGEKSRQALLVLADASAFLQPPYAEIPTTAAPDAHTQNVILAKAAETLMSSIHKLPDFYAQQTTTRFHDLKVSYLSPVSAPVIVEHQAFHPLDNFSGTVYYRNGKEEEEAKTDKYGRKIRPRNGLVNWGAFGQLQRIVVTDIYKGKMEWGHWEQRSTGPVAVFRYSIPKEKSNYVVNYCCIGLPNEAWHDFQSIPPFHGEIAIDAATGAVYRLMIVTELSPDAPIFQADIVVEYEPVEIGGTMYVCPRKSVTITTAIPRWADDRGVRGAGCSRTARRRLFMGRRIRRLTTRCLIRIMCFDRRRGL